MSGVLVVEMAGHALRFEGIGSPDFCRRQAGYLRAALRTRRARFDVRDDAGVNVASLRLDGVTSVRVEESPAQPLPPPHDPKLIASGG